MRFPLPPSNLVGPSLYEYLLQLVQRLNTDVSTGTAVYARDFGARANDNSFDNRIALQRAIDAAGEDGTVIMDPALYRVTGGLVMPESGTGMVSTGGQYTILGDYNGSTPILTIGNTSARTERQLLSDCRLTGRDSGNRPDYGLRIIRTTNGRLRGYTGTFLKIGLLDIQSMWEWHCYDIRGQLIGQSSTTTTGIIHCHPESGSNENVTQNHFEMISLGSTIGTVFRLDGESASFGGNTFAGMVVETYPSGGPYTSDATAQLMYLNAASNNQFNNFNWNINSRADAQGSYAIEASGSGAVRGNHFSNGTLYFTKFGSVTNVPTGFVRTRKGAMFFTDVSFQDREGLIPNNQMMRVDTSVEPDLFHRIHLRDCEFWTDKTYSQLFFDPVFILGTFSIQQVANPFATKQIDQRFLAKDYSDYSTAGTGEDNLAVLTLNNYALAYTNGVRIRAAGTITGAGGTKTIKLYIHTQTVTLLSAVTTTNDWRLEAEVLWSAFNTWRVSWVFYDGATIAGQGYEDMSVVSTVQYTTKLTGECANGGDVITQKMWVVERMDTR